MGTVKKIVSKERHIFIYKCRNWMIDAEVANKILYLSQDH